MLRQVVVTKGVPLALYSDRHGIFVKTSKQEPSLEEQLSGRRQLTQMGRLLGELQVELILARSPQAKGRIERLWGTFQDRLGSELRLQGVATMQWFLDLNVEDEPLDHSSLAKNRQRLLDHRVSHQFFEAVVAQARRRHLLSSQHFTVDGTLLESRGGSVHHSEVAARPHKS